MSANEEQTREPGVVEEEPTAEELAGAAEDAEETTVREIDEASDDVSRLQAMLEESTTRARQTSDRLREVHERHLRLAAEFENYKKRATREREETVRLANERLLKDLLPVLDNLERAVAASETGDSTTLLEGVKLVTRQFVETLGRYGARPFESVGQPFDPNRHEALMQQEAEGPANTVLSEMAKGYHLHDRLLRPAMVVVSRPPAEPAGDTPAEAAEAAGGTTTEDGGGDAQG